MAWAIDLDERLFAEDTRAVDGRLAELLGEQCSLRRYRPLCEARLSSSRLLPPPAYGITKPTRS